MGQTYSLVQKSTIWNKWNRPCSSQIDFLKVALAYKDQLHPENIHWTALALIKVSEDASSERKNTLKQKEQRKTKSMKVRGGNLQILWSFQMERRKSLCKKSFKKYCMSQPSLYLSLLHREAKSLDSVFYKAFYLPKLFHLLVTVSPYTVVKCLNDQNTNF